MVTTVPPPARDSVAPEYAEALGDRPSPEAPAPSRRPWTTSPAIGEALFWATHVAFWAVAFGGMLLVIDVFRPAVPVSVPLVAIRTALCFVATAGMRWLSKRERLLSRLGMSKIGVVAGGVLTSAALITVGMGIVERVVGPNPDTLGRGGLLARFVIDFLILGNWCAIYFGIQLVRERNTTEFRAVEAESLALRNELHRLQAQISPHFLFNALNTIVASREDPEAIDTVTQALASYLRFLLRPVAVREPLARELDALEQYLTVQTVRFGDGLVTRIDCDLDVRAVSVPPALLQPLVENALKYGAESGTRPLRVEIRACRDGDWLALEVANTGRWAPPVIRPSTGTGLRSLERRLRLLVGPAATVVHGEEDGWVRVRIRLPLDGPHRHPEAAG